MDIIGGLIGYIEKAVFFVGYIYILFLYIDNPCRPLGGFFVTIFHIEKMYLLLGCNRKKIMDIKN